MSAHVEIAHTLGHNKCRALPLFHAFTDCDTVSECLGKENILGHMEGSRGNHISFILCALSETPGSIEEWMETLEHFVVIRYASTSSLYHVNEVRKVLFIQKGGNWILYLPRVHPLSSTSEGSCIRLYTAGARCWFLNSHFQRNVDGSEVPPAARNHVRQICLRPWTHVVNSPDVETEKVVQDIAGVARLHSMHCSMLLW